MNKSALIGELDSQRFEDVRRLLEGTFDLEVLQAKTFIEIVEVCKRGTSELKMVLLTDRFPLLDQQWIPLQRCFMEFQAVKMCTSCGALIGYVYDNEASIKEFKNLVELTVPFPSSTKTKEKLIERFESFFPDSRWLTIVLDDDPLLNEQVRMLGADRNLADGQRKLKVFLSRFLDHQQVTIYRLQSGYSGAHVYRVQAPVQDGGPQYLIKVSRERWKLQEETERHMTVIGGIPGLRQYKAKILEPKNELHKGNYIVSHRNWHAICFEYLGGNAFGSSLNLQDTLVDIPKKIFLATADGSDGVSQYRSHFLDILLDWLKREWCTNRDHIVRENLRPWSTVNAEEGKYNPFPPYQLTGQTKGWILEFFDGIGTQMGNRLLPDWNAIVDLVKRFIGGDGNPANSKIEQQISMILSPAHGDLNANNVLFFPGLTDPIFLIDFAMYQKRGHALQDFARLETEIKYALMDRQADSPVKELPGFDITPTQFQLWLELENHLLGNIWWETKDWRSTGFGKNLDLSLKLVQSTRSAAKVVQSQNLPGEAPRFEDEYLYPLLYHTLQAITYRSLSPYKRLLALYSAAQLLWRAGFADEI